MEKQSWEILGHMIELFGYSNIEQIRMENPMYEEILKKAFALEEEIGQLGLEEEHRMKIDELLEQRTLAETEERKCAYLAGFLDCYRILHDKGMILM